MMAQQFVDSDLEQVSVDELINELASRMKPYKYEIPIRPIPPELVAVLLKLSGAPDDLLRAFQQWAYAPFVGARELAAWKRSLGV